MRQILCMFLCAAALSVQAGDGNYAVSAIPVVLMKNANVVIRFEETRFTIKSINKTNLYHHYIFTILNENGDRFAKAVEDYDKLHSIDYIDGNLYDAGGKKVKSLKKSDIKDFSGTSESSLADDNRIKAHDFYCRVYPYTVEYEVSIDYNHSMYFPEWKPLTGEFVSVEYSKFKVAFPQDYTLRYKAYNYQGGPQEQIEKGEKSFIWELKNQPAIEGEYASPPWYEITPAVFIAPTKFEVQGYVGDMSTWKDFGKFRQALLGGRDVLPEAIRQKVHQLTDGVSDTREKVTRLYRFMQDNTHYISIQLGIGGWQPFDASYVAAKKYGDCKALSNFMGALLKEAGIKACYTVIKAGSGKTAFRDNFPSNQFNHAILCVVDKADTIWLECTSQTVSAGYMGSFTGNRYALMITDEGGVLVRTPKYGYKDNLQNRIVKAVVDETGNVLINAATTYRAEQQEELHGIINGLSKEKVMEVLKEQLDLPQYDVIKYDYKETSSAMPVIRETLQLSATNYAQVSGKRIFIAPNILSSTHFKMMPAESRRYDVVLEYEYTDVDSAEIQLPAGYIPESLPEPVALENKFGKYTATVKVEGTAITYYRRLEKYGGRFPAAEYNNLVKFWQQVYKADRTKVVMVRKE